MAINPTCDNCGKELTHYGAIVLSPPDTQGKVKKFHICTDCYVEPKGVGIKAE